MPPRIFLTTYHPLIIRAEGRTAVEKYNLPPFVDASCRREPDFEHLYPSISALCHADKFAPRLKVGDIAVYLTVKGLYLGVRPPHWRLTAILRVIKWFEKHRDAADWYQGQGLALPSNCLVRNNPPMPLDKTVGHFKKDKKMVKAQRVEDWDVGYHARVRKWGVFLACEPLFTNLYDPPILTSDNAGLVFDKQRMLSTQNPPVITPSEFARLKHVCGLP